MRFAEADNVISVSGQHRTCFNQLQAAPARDAMSALPWMIFKSATTNPFRILSLVGLLLFSVTLHAQTGAPMQSQRSGNPVLPGWYADPEGVVINNRYWIFPTYSAHYDQQVFMDAFSSPDLVTWTRHARIIDTAAFKWARRAMWAPAMVEKGGKFYLFFAANDIQQESALGGIGVAVAEKPEGPYKDWLGKPLINGIVNKAQPIDQFVFRDADGQYYMIYGGWGRCNMVKLKDDFTGLLPFDDGQVFREITPQGYVEGPFLFQRKGKYYFMWSEGGWTGPDYRVAYAMADTPFGPWTRMGTVLQQDPAVATGAGHHSVIQVPGTDEWLMVYHRRPLGETDANHRVTCIDKMAFDEQGRILPVKISFEGVTARPLQ
jgi:beta-xylosidase